MEVNRVGIPESERTPELEKKVPQRSPTAKNFFDDEGPFQKFGEAL